MIEFFLGVFLGYTVGKAVGTATSMLRKPDKILKWDPQSLGYRPVHISSTDDLERGCFVCYEVKSESEKR